MEFIILLGLLAAVISLFMRSSRLGQRLSEQDQRLGLLEAELELLRERTGAFANPRASADVPPCPAPPVASAPAGEAGIPLPAPSRPPAPPPIIHAGPPDADTVDPFVAAHRRAAPAPNFKPDPAPGTPVPATPSTLPRTGVDWEQFLGVKLFAWIGGLALFLGVAFFIKYSFDHGLIPPWLRVAAGMAIGVVLTAGGAWLNGRQRTVPAQTLCGTGIVILYTAAFAGRGFYQFPLFTSFNTGLLMAGITTAAFLLAVRLNAVVVAILGLLGGFLTPFLVSSGQDNTAGLFSYLGLLDLGLIAVAARRPWPWLVTLGALGTVGLQSAWFVQYFSPPRLGTTVAVLAGFNALFLGAFRWNRRRGETDPWTPAAPLITAGFTFFLGFLLTQRTGLPESPLWLFTLVLAADLTIMLMSGIDRSLRRLSLVAGGAAMMVVSAWMLRHLDPPRLPWALGITVMLALLHTGLPAWWQRHSAAGDARWTDLHLFPALCLGLLLIPLLQLPATPWSVWWVVLCLDVLAIALALLSVSIAGVVASLVMTTALAIAFVNGRPLAAASATGPLVITACMAALFVGAGWLVHRFRPGRLGSFGDGTPDPALEPFRLLPGLSAVPPFFLLCLILAVIPVAQPSPVFGVALGIVLGLLALTRRLDLSWLPAGALLGGVAVQCSWHLHHFDRAHPWEGVIWHLVFFLVHAGFPLVCARGLRDMKGPWIIGALAGPIQFLLIHRELRAAYPDFAVPGLVPLGFAVWYLAATFRIRRQLPREHPDRLSRLAWYAGVSLLFITLIWPIQFERQWITISWACEGVALLACFHRLPHPGLRATGLGLLVAAFVRLAGNPAVYFDYPPSGAKILNWYLYAYGVVTILLLNAQRLVEPRDWRIGRVPVRGMLGVLAGVLAFVLVNIEIADYFSPGGRLEFQFSGSLARDLSYTIAWSLFALGLLVLGLVRDERWPRRAGAGLLSVTLAKLFLHDLAHLNQLYRIGALIVVSVIAIGTSFLYQRFFSRRRNSAPPPPPAP